MAQRMLLCLLAVSVAACTTAAKSHTAAMPAPGAWLDVAELWGESGRHLLQSGVANATVVPQTVGFGDVKLPKDYVPPPVAEGAGLPSENPLTDENPFSAAAASAAQRTAAAPPLPNQLTICDSIRICSGSTRVKLHGVNWFGFETGQTMVDGLYAGPTSETLDFITVLRRIKLLGFNTIRLPFSMKDLFDKKSLSWVRNCPDGGAANPNSQKILNSVKKPGLKTGSAGTTALRYVPPGAISTDGKAAVCNSYLPNSSTLARFLWVVGVLARNNFIVIIDNHLNLDTTIMQNQQQWLSRWVKIAQEINKDAYAKRRVIFDILNEPDAQGLRWEPSSDASRPSMTTSYLRVMDAVHKINSNFLFAIEGLGQGALGANWGDGLATAADVLKNTGASDPNPFFRTLLTKPYRNKVVIAPHVYPPSITSLSNEYLLTAPGFYRRLSSSFGYLNKQGYCYNGKCQRFPVVLGEFGSRLRDCRNRCALAGCLTTELRNMNLLIKYMNNDGDANDGKHNSIDGWAWWAWNANSGDTGGIVDDDWSTVIWQKISYLGKVGLTPWYSKFCGSKCFATLLTSSLGSCANSCGSSSACPGGFKCVLGKCCAAASTCNGKCCASGTPCVNGVCCPTKQQCGASCCKSGQSCYNGGCVDDSKLKKCGTFTCLKTGACAYKNRGCCLETKTASTTRCCGLDRVALYSKLESKRTCCDPPQVCGQYCCGSTQSCIGGKCCTASKVCGGKCCALGQSCLNGNCVSASQTRQCGKETCPTSVRCDYNYKVAGRACCAAGKTCGKHCCKSTEKCVNSTCMPAQG